jgi:hypothetical protein
MSKESTMSDEVDALDLVELMKTNNVTLNSNDTKLYYDEYTGWMVLTKQRNRNPIQYTGEELEKALVAFIYLLNANE